MQLIQIGRGNDNDVVISDPTVSRQHAQLIVDDLGDVTLVDLNSSNGTYVNGQRIRDPKRLQTNDIVKLGEYLFPWRNHLGTGTRTASGVGSAGQEPAPPVVESIASPQSSAAPGDAPAAPGGGLPWKWIGIGGGALVVIVVLLVWILGGSSKPTLDGRWVEYENGDAWIEFGPAGKYTEGLKNAVTNDSLTWRAMGVDRILFKHGNVEFSKIYKFDGEDLKLSWDGKTTLYERAKEK